MRKVATFVTTAVLLVAPGAPAWAGDTRPSGDHRASSSTPDGVPAQFHVNHDRRDRYDGRYPRNRYEHDGRHSRDGWDYRNGRWYYDDGHGRYHYDRRYYHGRPYHGGTRHCHDGEWRYHPRYGWVCA